MPFNPDRLLARQVDVPMRWTMRDTMLYALGIGASELDYVYENGLKALPTMPVALGYPGFEFWSDPNLGIDTGKILHGETEVELHGGLPADLDIVGENRVTRVIDKGEEKGAVVLQERLVRDVKGNAIATVRNTSILRGNGGFGGSSEGQPAPRTMPEDRTPDKVITFGTRRDQALLYRLSGDYNPLHADPMVASKAGFPQPILHGLCSFGIAGRAVVKGLCDDDPSRVARIGVRFSSPVYPGETIRTHLWRDGDRASFRAYAVERDVLILNNGYVEFQ